MSSNKIEVRCPHCGDRGQLALQPALSVDIGPCPRCSKPVVLVGVQVLALRTDIMSRGTREQKHDHVMSVLNGYLNRCVIEFND